MKELKLAIKAAIAGGLEIMKIYEGDNFEVESKDDDSPLTIADKKANDVINEVLLQMSIPIISEENKQLSYDVREQWETCWIVDPLDGTKEFIKKNGEFTVNIALIKKGRPALGVIYIPVEKTLYFGNVEESKSFRIVVKEQEDVDSIISRAKEIKPSSGKENIRVVGSRSHMSEDTLKYIESLKLEYNQDVEIVSKGSSLKFCLVAEGEADVYPRFAPTMEWDTAAGQAICEAVGLSVIDKMTSKPMLYNRENLLNNYFLVSNLG